MSLGDELPPAPKRTARVQVIVTSWNDAKVSDGIEVTKEQYGDDPNYRKMVENMALDEVRAGLDKVLMGREPKERA